MADKHSDSATETLLVRDRDGPTPKPSPARRTLRAFRLD